MGNGNTWRIVRMVFADKEDLEHLIRAEFGLTDGYFSLVSAPPKSEKRRAEISIYSESNDRVHHREVSGKVIRGLNQDTAQKLIERINIALASGGARLVLKEVRETVHGKTIIIYKRRDLRGPASISDQTPPPLNYDPCVEVTAVNIRPANTNMTRRLTD